MTPPRNALLDQVTSEARLRRRPALSQAVSLTVGRNDRTQLLGKVVDALVHGGCRYGEAWLEVGHEYIRAVAAQRVREKFPGTERVS